MMRFVAPLLRAMAVIVAVSAVTFVIQTAIPGDPAELYVGPRPSLTTEERAHLVEIESARLGLDKPLPVRYALWVANAARGDFGTDVQGADVLRSVVTRMGPSLELAILSTALAIPIAVWLAIAVVRRRRRGVWQLLNSIAIAGLVIPPFWIGLLLVLAFCVWQPWLPASGYVSFTSDPVQHVERLVLPLLTLTATQVAVYYRFLQQALREAMRSQFVRTARAKGLTERRVLYRHALPNALLPSITLLGIQIGALVGGIVIVERVFSWPGVGSLLLFAVQSGSYNTVTFIVLVTAVVYVVMSGLVDVSYRLIDPRLRRG